MGKAPTKFCNEERTSTGKALPRFLAAAVVLCLMAGGLRALAQQPYPGQEQYPAQQYPGQEQYPEQGQYPEQQQYEPYTPEQLDNLLAPIALYPDPLLAQVLPASTFVDQVDAAARYVRAYGDRGVDDMPWDLSVRSVAHYPAVLQMMDNQLDWTTALGQAYVYQSTDVMMSVQRLRRMAYDQGNLISSPEWQIVNQGGYISIWPANPRYIYVPVYNPQVVYFRRRGWGGFFGLFISFGPRFSIGVWLNRDFDWHQHRIAYTGWRGGGWVGRSRPYIHENHIYVGDRARSITVNRAVVRRPVNVENVNRFNSVHRNVIFTRRGAPGNRSMPPNAEPNRRPNPVNNRVIQRNINTNNPRLNQFRGWQNAPRQAPAQTAPPAREPVRTARPMPARERPVQMQPPRQTERSRTNAFDRSGGSFNPRTTSERGRSSRAQENVRRVTPSRPAARPQPQPKRENRQRSEPKRNSKPERPHGRRP